MGKGAESLNKFPNVSPTRTLQWLRFIWPKFCLWNAKRDWWPWLLWDTGTGDGEGYFLQEKPGSIFPWLFLLILWSLEGRKLGKDFGMSRSFQNTGIRSLWGLERCSVEISGWDAHSQLTWMYWRKNSVALRVPFQFLPRAESESIMDLEKERNQEKTSHGSSCTWGIKIRNLRSLLTWFLCNSCLSQTLMWKDWPGWKD